MARPERNNVDYFPHPVNHGKKMFYLRQRFGNDGYAVWFVLLEQLGKADYHYLNLQDPIQLMYLTAECMVSEPVLLGVVDILVQFGSFDKELWKSSKVIFSNEFVESVEDAYTRRSNQIITRGQLLIHLQGLGIHKPNKQEQKQGNGIEKDNNNPQSRVEDTKLKKSRVFTPPTIDEVRTYFAENGYTNADKAFNYYSPEWKDSNGKPVLNWKQKMQGVWFKEENKIPNDTKRLVSHQDRDLNQFL